jgi:hypothetical protein
MPLIRSGSAGAGADAAAAAAASSDAGCGVYREDGSTTRPSAAVYEVTCAGTGAEGASGEAATCRGASAQTISRSQGTCATGWNADSGTWNVSADADSFATGSPVGSRQLSTATEGRGGKSFSIACGS